MSPAAHLSNLEPRIIDGVPWWELRQVCEALRIPDVRAAGRLVEPPHKRYIVPTCRVWTMRRRVGIIDRRGVEILAIRYGGKTPRATLMAALNAEAVR